MNLIFKCPRQRIGPAGPEWERPALAPITDGVLCQGGVGSTSTPYLPDRNLGNEWATTMGAWGSAAPQMLSLDTLYGPQYANLNLGMMENANPRLNAMNAATESAGRAADISDLSTYGPGAMAALRGANPQQTSLMDALNAMAGGQLALGGNLSSAQQRQAQQYLRAAPASRGMGMGPGDALAETLGEQQFGQNLLGQRQAFAGQVAGMNQQQNSQLYDLLTRLRGGGASTAMNLVNNSGPRWFSPDNSYAEDLYNTNFNAKYAVAQANASKNAALGAGMMSGIGQGVNAGGSALAKGGGMM